MPVLTTIMWLICFLPGSISRDTLGRRALFVDPVSGVTTRYYYDGPSVIEERDGSDARDRDHVNGAQYVQEHVTTFDDASATIVYYLHTATSIPSRPSPTTPAASSRATTTGPTAFAPSSFRSAARRATSPATAWSRRRTSL